MAGKSKTQHIIEFMVRFLPESKLDFSKISSEFDKLFYVEEKNFDSFKKHSKVMKEMIGASRLYGDEQKKAASKSTTSVHELANEMKKVLEYDGKEAELLLKETEHRKKIAEFEKTRGARLGFNLSLLFTSWTVSRKIGNLLDSWKKTYMQVTQGQTEFSNQVNQTSAAMSFLGFVIYDTFSRQPFVQKMVETFVDLANATADFVSAHPKITMSIVMGAFAVKTLADMLTIVSQFNMLKDAFLSLKNGGAISKTIKFSQDISEELKNLVTFATSDAAISKVITFSFTLGAIYVTGEILKNFNDDLQKVGEKFGSIIEKVLGERLSHKIALTLSKVLYGISTALGPVGDWFLDVIGTDKESLKEMISELEKINLEDDLAEQLKDIKESGKDIFNILGETPDTTGSEVLKRELDEIIQKYKELKEVQQSVDLSNPFVQWAMRGGDNFTNYGG